MPDVVYIDSGTDTPVSTDFVNIGGINQHIQRVKLVDGTDGSYASISGNGIYGLSVDVTRLPEFVLSSQANPFTDDLSITGNVNILSMPSVNLTNQANPFTSPINVSGGNLVVYPYCLPASIKQYSAVITDSGDHVAIIGTVSTYVYITHISVMNSHLTTGTAVFITDGSLGSSDLYCGYAGANGGGFTSSFPVPLRSTIGSGINFHATTSGTNLYVNINGYSSTV